MSRDDTFTSWRRGIATSTVRFEQLEDDDNDHGQTDPPPKGPAASDRPAGPDAVPTLCECGECKHIRGETR